MMMMIPRSALPPFSPKKPVSLVNGGTWYQKLKGLSYQEPQDPSSPRQSTDGPPLLGGNPRRYEVDKLVARADHSQRPIAGIRALPAITVPADTPLRAAAQLMQRKNIGRLVVVDHRGRIAGIVSRSNLLLVRVP
jgi:CBS domain-containing protein